MSQHWHGHWTEDAFAPKRLRNWEIPKRYPSWPNKHCISTKFITDDNGHILDCAKKAECSPWRTYKILTMKYYGKGTWDLPRRITKSIVEELSAAPQRKNEASKSHKRKQLNLRKKIKQGEEEPREDIAEAYSKRKTNRIAAEVKTLDPEQNLDDVCPVKAQVDEKNMRT